MTRARSASGISGAKPAATFFQSFMGELLYIQMGDRLPVNSVSGFPFALRNFPYLASFNNANGSLTPILPTPILLCGDHRATGAMGFDQIAGNPFAQVEF